MATAGPSSGGDESPSEYLYSDDLYVDPPPEKFSCPVCLCPVQREPYLTECCGKHFCFACISQVQRGIKSCPTCMASGLKIFPNKERQREINELKVRCPRREREPKCEWNGELGYVEQHLLKKHATVTANGSIGQVNYLSQQQVPTQPPRPLADIQAQLEKIIYVLDNSSPEQQQQIFAKIRATPEQQQQLMARVQAKKIQRQQQQRQWIQMMQQSQQQQMQPFSMPSHRAMLGNQPGMLGQRGQPMSQAGQSQLMLGGGMPGTQAATGQVNYLSQQRVQPQAHPQSQTQPMAGFPSASQPMNLPSMQTGSLMGGTGAGMQSMPSAGMVQQQQLPTQPPRPLADRQAQLEKIIYVLDNSSPEQQQQIFAKIRVTPEQQQQLMARVQANKIQRQQQQRQQIQMMQQSQQQQMQPFSMPSHRGAMLGNQPGMLGQRGQPMSQAGQSQLMGGGMQMGMVRPSAVPGQQQQQGQQIPQQQPGGMNQGLFSSWQS